MYDCHYKQTGSTIVINDGAGIKYMRKTQRREIKEGDILRLRNGKKPLLEKIWVEKFKNLILDG